MIGLNTFDVLTLSHDVKAAGNKITPYSHMYHPSEVFDVDLKDKMSFIFVEEQDLQQVLEHYLWCKARAPSRTGACFLVPTTMGKKHKWTPLLKGMELLKQYGSGDRILYNPETGKKVGQHRKLEVWYDPAVGMPSKEDSQILAKVLTTRMPYSVLSIGTKQRRRKATHKMLFRGDIQGHSARFLVDTGATHNYITESMWRKVRTKLKNPEELKSLVAGNTSISILGETTVKLHIGNYVTEVEVLVVKDILEGIDVVLGEEWIGTENADIYYSKKLIHLHKSNCVIHPICHEQDSRKSPLVASYAIRKELGTEVDSDIIQAKTAMKALRKGCPYMIINVRKSEPSSERLPETKGTAREEHDLPTMGMILRGDVSAKTHEAYVAAQRDAKDTLKLLVATSGQKSDQWPKEKEEKEKEEKEQATETPQETQLTIREQVELCVPDDAQTPGLIKREKLINLLHQYEDVFQDLPDGLPPDRNIGHTIRLEQDATPPYRRNRRMSPAELEICEEYVGNLLKKGYITPSASPFGAPIMFVAKPAGGFRVVCDWRALNKLTIKNRYPIPRIDETLDKLSGATIFTSLDLNSGYFQIRISEEDAHKTAFTTPMGQYEFKVLGQGLVNSPATFQAVMNRIFKDQIDRKFLVVYLDDIMIFGKNPEEHFGHVKEVLDILRKEQFYAKLPKCSFNQPEVQFLGHIVGRDGIKVNPKKIEVVKDWPIPKDVKQIRQFLGLTNYFRRFIQGYSSLTAPLMDLTRKSVDFQSAWTKDHEQIFNQLKEALTSAPVLILPDFEKPFEVISDASLLGTGAVLLQEGRVVSYASKKFIAAERNYTTTEQELLGVVHAMKEWRCYLEGAESVTLVTDHNPLKYLTDKPELTRRLGRWMEFLAPYKFNWEYRKGRDNVADPISRSPMLEVCAVLMAWSIPGLQPPQDIMTKIKKGYKNDPKFAEGIPNGFQKKDGYYFQHDRIVVPEVEALRKEIMDMHHTPPYVGHPGRDRTYELIHRTFYWPKMNADVKAFVKSCHQCQTNKPTNQKKAGELKPVEIPPQYWECVTTDLITKLPPTKSGYDAVVVFVDKLSKMVKIEPCHTDIDAPKFAQIFHKTVARNHGWPSKILSDRDARFTGHFWKSICNSLGMQQAFSTAFHPETDGQTERMNRVIEDALRSYVNAYHDDWDEFLYMVEFAINNSHQSSIGMTPFFALYGFHPHTPSSLMTKDFSDRVPNALKFLKVHSDRKDKAQECLKAAQARQKTQADKSRRPVSYQEGDWVLLSTKNLKFKAKGAPKFAPRWVGPFKVIKVLGMRRDDPGDDDSRFATAVKLQLPPLMRIHPVFHVSLVKEYFGDIKDRPIQPLDFDHDGAPLWDIECILQDRVHKVTKVKESLVRWKGFGPDQDVWVATNELKGTQVLANWQNRIAPVAHRKRKQPQSVQDPPDKEVEVDVKEVEVEVEETIVSEDEDLDFHPVHAKKSKVSYPKNQKFKSINELAKALLLLLDEDA